MNASNTPEGRRELIKTAGLLVGGSLLGRSAVAGEGTSVGQKQPGLRQSVSRWCFGSMSVDQLAANAARIGFAGIDLVGPEDWPILKRHGLICPMIAAGGAIDIAKGLNRPEHHPAIIDTLRRNIDVTAEAGFPNVICFSGNRGGLSDEEGLTNCAKALLEVVGHAEKKGVTVCLELLNSKVDHKDYMADHTAWGVALAKRVGSPRFKLLYDIYHMQIMEGDIIRTIRENSEFIGHFHTAGNPGRHEIGPDQEINYAAIRRAIEGTGYRGFVAHEFVPQGTPLESLEEAFRIFA